MREKEKRRGGGGGDESQQRTDKQGSFTSARSVWRNCDRAFIEHSPLPCMHCHFSSICRYPHSLCIAAPAIRLPPPTPPPAPGQYETHTISSFDRQTAPVTNAVFRSVTRRTMHPLAAESSIGPGESTSASNFEEKTSNHAGMVCFGQVRAAK